MELKMFESLIAIIIRNKVCIAKESIFREGKSGKHAICLDNTSLLKWNYKKLPQKMSDLVPKNAV